jgi:hypothetical protein
MIGSDQNPSTKHVPRHVAQHGSDAFRGGLMQIRRSSRLCAYLSTNRILLPWSDVKSLLSRNTDETHYKMDRYAWGYG